MYTLISQVLHFHAVFLHPYFNFFDERHSLMMLLLPFDVIYDLISLIARIGECTITLLPAIPFR